MLNFSEAKNITWILLLYWNYNERPLISDLAKFYWETAGE